MNNSVVLARVQGPDRPPLQASIVAVTMPFGRWNFAIGILLVTSRTKACHSGAAAVSEIAGCFARGIE
jgi:hypothetical protein